MHKLLFKNRFNALVFVAIILFSVRILVGTDNERGALEKATEQFGTEQPQVSTQQQESPVVRQVVTEFTPDEELVDDTSGLDPSGWSSEPDVDEGLGLEIAVNPPVSPDG